ncbi:uncharacterized protein LOC124437312 isoform X2 [Xenia sp. Carnegie-2017]|uniref:uncharacterized protein LOC124437312 isoform X2 n=1 Tax=Xenia sp. Carnegie-2017 TaxID=2897299 RepID=UPI001F0373F3|nr:uncharacterized protein LOC124437312 isoform X2 [Xenia sp. Carnegie-2017]
MPFGNLVFAASILFSDSNPSKVLQFLRHSGIEFLSERTYSYIQTIYLIPSVSNVWHMNQKHLLESIRERNINIGGDGRCDSPGHCAKYGSYSCMDLKSNNILDTQLVQSNEVTNTGAMELEGFKRCLAKFDESGMKVKSMTTDRHAQIKSYMSKQRPKIEHYFDVWHVAKGIKKKILAASKKSGCKLLSDWAQLISNHVYWCAASNNDNEELVKAKWLSVLNHICEIHEGHSDVFPKCEHDMLEPRMRIKKVQKLMLSCL